MERTAGDTNLAEAPTSTRLKRGKRREMILDASADLFRRNGYHATGIDEIGEAVGITGPAVYRHFPSKDDLLAAVLERYIDRYQSLATQSIESCSDPYEALVRLVETAGESALEHRDVTALFLREMPNLPDEHRSRLVRKQRAVVSDWVRIIRRVHPELTEDDARLAVRAIGGLVDAVSNYGARVGPDRLKERVVKMVLGLLAG